MAAAWALVPQPATLCAAGQAEADGKQAHNGDQTSHDEISIADHAPCRDKYLFCRYLNACIARLHDRGVGLGLFSMDESPI